MDEPLKEQLLERRIQARNKLAHLEKCVAGFNKSIQDAKREVEELDSAFAKLSVKVPTGKPPLPAQYNPMPWNPA